MSILGKPRLGWNLFCRATCEGKGEQQRSECKCGNSLWFITKMNFPVLPGQEHSCQPQGCWWETNPSSAGKDQQGNPSSTPMFDSLC